MAARDSFCYVAELARFQVINIADSTHPSALSICTLALSFNEPADISLGDSTAYIADWPDGGMRIIDITDPHNVTPIGIWMPQNLVMSVKVADTIAYVGTDQDFEVVNVRDPASPVRVGSIATPGSIALHGQLAFVTGRSTILDITDPTAPRQVGYYDGPPGAVKAQWGDSLIYAACSEAGVVILRYTGDNACMESSRPDATPPQAAYVTPNPAVGVCRLRVWPPSADVTRMALYDCDGRLVENRRMKGGDDKTVDLTGLKEGIYFLRARVNERDITVKMTKVK